MLAECCRTEAVLFTNERNLLTDEELKARKKEWLRNVAAKREKIEWELKGNTVELDIAHSLLEENAFSLLAGNSIITNIDYASTQTQSRGKLKKGG